MNLPYFPHLLDTQPHGLSNAVTNFHSSIHNNEHYQCDDIAIASPTPIGDLYLSSPEEMWGATPEQRSQISESYEITYGITELPAMAIAEVRRVTKDRAVEPWTAPLQTWEGRVLYVDHEQKAMDVMLVDKSGRLPDHNARMSLEWVTDQDQELVKQGAIFYLMLYKEKNRGSLKNSQELRFRRLPNWSRSQITKIHCEAEKLLPFFSDKPLMSQSAT